MLKDETIEFLKGISPFDKLSHDELISIADDMVLEYYPKGVTILAQNGPASEYLRLIKKGGVKVYVGSKDDDEILIDYRSEGEQFGLLSVISGDRSRANIMAVEDTICYLISREKVLEIFRANPKVNEYFLKSFFINFIDKTYDETRRKYAGLGEGERLLYITPVGDIITKKPITGRPDTTIQQAAEVMTEHRISSMIIADEAGVPVGIVTDRDLRDKVVSKGRDITESVRQIMSSPLIRVDAEEYCFEALLKMMRYKIHHILVVRKGQFMGVVTNHDFMVLQGSSPTVLVKEMEDVQKLEELAGTMPKLYKTISTLLREGARANNITGLITELSEKLINRMLDLIEEKNGKPPLPYTLFIYGSGGRRELSLNVRPLLGIIYEDTSNLTVYNKAKEYFAKMTEDLLLSIGDCFGTAQKAPLRPCLVKTVSEWKDLFNSWKYERKGLMPEPEYFDMRQVRGAEAPVEVLRDHLYSLASKGEVFMDLVATTTVANRPPLGFFKRFVVEKSGEHRNELDLSIKGVGPLADAVRIFSVEKGVKDISTSKRATALSDRYDFEHNEDIEHALNYLNTLLVHNQLEQIKKGLAPDDFLNPEALASIERRTLKEIFQLTATLYDMIEKSYRTERVG